MIDQAYVEHGHRPHGEADWNNTLIATNKAVWRICGHRCHPSVMNTSAALAQAMANLEHNIHVIGVTERWEDFAQALLFYTNTPKTSVGTVKV